MITTTSVEDSDNYNYHFSRRFRQLYNYHFISRFRYTITTTSVGDSDIYMITATSVEDSYNYITTTSIVDSVI
jgi:hypothetical protein